MRKKYDPFKEGGCEPFHFNYGRMYKTAHSTFTNFVYGLAQSRLEPGCAREIHSAKALMLAIVRSKDVQCKR